MLTELRSGQVVGYYPTVADADEHRRLLEGAYTDPDDDPDADAGDDDDLDDLPPDMVEPDDEDDDDEERMRL
jgi:hypothetical protein